MKTPRLLAAFAGTVVLAFAAPIASAQTTLTMSSWVGPNHLLAKDILVVWAASVAKATNGRVKLQMLPKHPSAAPGTFAA